MKYYFFRDISTEGSLLNGRTFHAAGIVDRLNCELGKPNKSGKDVSVTFFDPFYGCFASQWRSLVEVELFEVDQWEYEEIQSVYKKLDEIDK